MRMIRAVIRPDREEQVVNALESAGIVSLTKMDVFGRGQQRGVQVGNTIYSELPKVMLTIVVEEAKLDAAITAIHAGAKTGQHGDGKIFISPVDAVYTVRTGQCSRGL
jgi:nitrogen regulatory protein PII 1